jgi:hypothetical protein
MRDLVAFFVHDSKQDGRTALDVAKQFRKSDMIRLLEVRLRASFP